MVPLRLDAAHHAEMRAHVAIEAPLEACGLVAGKRGTSAKVFAIRNANLSPTTFRMAPQEQLAAMLEIERAGWELLAIYHSHPNGPAGPSKTDIAEALYPGVVHLIWNRPGDVWTCRAFLLDGSQINSVEFEVGE